MKAFFRRLSALVRKEFLQILRDPSAPAIGLLLPAVLIVIFGFGMSLDVNRAPVAVCMERPTPLARSVLAGLEGSAYFSPAYVSSMEEACRLLRERRADAVIHTSGDFDREYMLGRAAVQVVLHGTDSTTASMLQNYISGAVALQVQKLSDRRGGTGARRAFGSAVIVPRIWFNEAATSTRYLVPGIIVIVMTIVGAFLTSLVMAREWERGTLECLFTTPASRAEILLSKIIPYFLLGMCGFAICLAAARWIFEVPMRGSLLLLTASSMLYLLAALGMGLAISSITRSQFLACEAALIASFLPAVILSGFLFDLRSIPAAARIVGRMLPATYYMEIVRTLFLAGDNTGIIVRDCLALSGYAVLFMAAAFRTTRKKLD